MLPIPEPIRGREPDTWAHSTITARLPEIGRRALRENDFPAAVAARLEALINDIPEAPLRLLRPDGAPDAAAWEGYIRPFRGQNWLEPPWFFVETYFYRRVLEATGYFAPGWGHQYDPFAYQKEQGLTGSRAAVHGLSAQLQSWRDAGWQAGPFAQALALALWGNQADLSLWPADGAANPQHGNLDAAAAHLLADDTTAVFTHLAAHPQARVDFLADNAGFELIGDLCLADYLLGSGAAGSVHLHLKQHPTFVSDALIQDVEATFAFLEGDADAAVQRWGARLRSHVENGRLHLRTHPFWTSPLAFWELPDDLRADLRQADLLISKGDANYRRLLGDRHWPFTTPFAAILAYAPAPLVALRTLKAELAAGLAAEQVARLNEIDPDWMINGRWGVIQFAAG
jgi:uncharacterized protein with ATP-grasp and redox domains